VESNKIEIKIITETSHFNERLEDLKRDLTYASEETLSKVRELFLDRPDFLKHLIGLETDGNAAGAGNILISLNPSDSFGMLLRAVRTGDFNSLIVEQ
jgi:hypothetical protein